MIGRFVVALVVCVAIAAATATATGVSNRGSASAARSESAPVGRVVWVSASGSGVADALVLSWLDGRPIRVLRPRQPGRAYSGPVWSPDGKRIAASTWLRTGTASAFVMNDHGGQLSVLGKGRTVTNSWAPDGKELALASALSECRAPAHAHQLWLRVVSSTGRSRALIGALDSRDLKATSYNVVDALSWAPDGHAFAYHVMHWGSSCDFRGAVEPSGSSVYVVDANGLHRVVLQRTVGGQGLAGPPAWSPDSSEVAFIAGCYKSFPSCTQLVLLRADGSDHRALEPAPVLSNSVAWSHTGDELYIGTANEGTGDPLGVAAFPTNGGTLNWLIRGCNIGSESTLELSRGGDKLLVVSAGYGGNCDRLLDLTSGRAWRATIRSTDADASIP